jgi:hypothetical protein
MFLGMRNSRTERMEPMTTQLDPGTLEPHLRSERFFHDRAKRTPRRDRDTETEPQFQAQHRPDEYWQALGYVKRRTIGGFEWVRPLLNKGGG